MHQHHNREPPAALRDAKFAGDGDGLAIGVAGQECWSDMVSDGMA
jgi:hypothetical protein